MAETARSLDGTHIAYERSGRGDPLLLLSPPDGLAARLSERFTVLSADPDRTGPSGTEDVAALLHAAGGAAYAYGRGTAANLLLEASAAHVPFARIVAHEPVGEVEGATVPTLMVFDEVRAVERATVHILHAGEDLVPIIEEFFG